ncbi:hypothetical protein [Methylotuvimicrobium alcaliphilum]|uniref:Uncharacterized protein n=1 Tax=Methylotuvimicrobium alcaliphilum (strain DSM 19304 / NCIMB 14124 / VKM B-2133 / 20Z) TaxID=1091494 RepID=G4T450_META2|nr:hypothetical protein [Methylotuvimicrobium alcaliphilum]CCE23785.1 protein of unknown function [Methylotuvimicrobium alcaliphilum 20Z]
MSYFLWVEDFEGDPKATASNVLGSVFNVSLFDEDKRALKKNMKAQGVFIELTLQDGLEFITSDLDKKVDYIILDIDLPAYPPDIAYKDVTNEELLHLLETFENYQKQEDETANEVAWKTACYEMKKKAGFYLYTKLVVNMGFPKDHILCCSDHGDQLSDNEKAFKAAKINPPTSYKKSDEDVKKWVKDHHQNSYSRLRRGIIEACRFLKGLPEDRYRFKEFIKEPEKHPGLDDVHDYLDVLANFLPLREPEQPTVFYKLLIRTLAHEWEAAEPQWLDKQNELYAFSWIMKMTRNWSAHSKIFERLEAQDVAYLFIVNMRAMFDLRDEVLPYERHLLSLFDPPLDESEMSEIYGRDFRSRKIPLIENYANTLHKTGNRRQAINFHDALNNLQKNKDKNIESEFFIKGLYQAFWFLTSNGNVNIPSDREHKDQIDMEKIKTFANLNYQFNYFNYQKSKFIFELARHIYRISFPETKS